MVVLVISKKDEFSRFYFGNRQDYERLREKALKCGLEVRKFRNDGIGLQVRDTGKKPFLDVEDFVDNHYNALFNQAAQFLERVVFIKYPQVLLEDDRLRGFLTDRDLQKFVHNYDDVHRMLKWSGKKFDNFSEFISSYLKEIYEIDLGRIHAIWKEYEE
jgi:hypothetical protein